MSNTENKTKLFALSANVELAKEISEYSGTPLAKCEVLHFADGEINVNIEETVRGCDVFVVQPTSAPANDHLMELLIMCDALRRASAKTINLVIPYLGYSRRDRKVKPWQPISARLIADLLETAGATRVTTFDLHARQIEGFYNIPIDNVPVMLILGHRWKKMREASSKFNISDFVVVSPDHGGVTRAREFMIMANIPNLVIINKFREKANVVSDMQVIGDVKNKNVIIIDDIVDTGGTLMRAASELKKAGALKVYIYCTHGVLSDGAIEKLSNCEDIEKLVITNTIDKSDELINDRIMYVDISDVVKSVVDAYIKNEDVYTYIINELEIK
jgi:ribose-phosphate pyrophosphokinase